MPQLIAGRYEVIEKRGHSGVGAVYKVRDPARPAIYALRMLSAGGPEIADRVANEARIIRELQHEGIVPVVDIARHEGLYCIITKWIHASTLQEYVTMHTLSPHESLGIARRLATALAYAHGRGITHGDVKPSNVLLDESTPPRALLTGFGLVSQIRTGSMLGGTPRYAAPEQFGYKRGNDALPVDARTDVFALGLVLYEMCEGRPFFADLETPAIFGKLLYDPAPLEPKFSRPVTFDVASVIARAIRRDPDERYGSMTEMLREIDRCLAEIAREAAMLEREARDVEGKDWHFTVVLGGKAQPRGRRTEPPWVDENVQFTVFRPHVVRPNRWYDVLAFAHLAHRRVGDPEAVDPLEEMQRQAERMLGSAVREYSRNTEDSRQGVPRDGEITFLPEVPGIEFNPPRRTFLWVEDIHREDFRMRAAPDRDGTVLRGRFSVFLGSILLADLAITVRVANAAPERSTPKELAVDRAGVYRRIFPSYSHRDADIVQQFERYAAALGDRYMRDVTQLRAGEVWNERIRDLIEQSQVFQLFWSHNSMSSPYVREEWEFALGLNRGEFVRPTYWEDPLPADPARNLPPPELARLHFHRLPKGPPLEPWTPAAEPLPNLADVNPPRGPVGRGRTARRWTGVVFVAILALSVGSFSVMRMGAPPPLDELAGDRRPAGGSLLEHPPAIVDAVPPARTVAVEANTATEFRVAASDPDDAAELRYEWRLDGGPPERTAANHYQLPPTLAPGSHSVEVVSVNERGLRSPAHRWTVDVAPVAEARTRPPFPAGADQITESEVRGWLSQYRAAFQSRDVPKLVTLGVIDAAQSDAVKSALAQYKNYTVSITSEHIVIEGRHATVRFDRTDADETGKALGPRHEEFRLEKRPEGIVATGRASPETG